MRIGFFGGSFDPPHRGHLAFALAAADRFLLDQVLLAPVGIQPLKDQQGADFIHRYAMTALAAQADPRLLPSLLDAPLLPAPQQDRRNYTVDTLARLQALLQIAGIKPQLFALVGADSLLSIQKWRHPERVLALCDWIVAARPEYKLGETPEDALAYAVASVPKSIQVSRERDELHGEFLRLAHPDGTATHLWFLPQLQEEVSATALRAAVAREAFAGEDWDASLLPEPVAEYIRKTGLYVG
jgi:nicotinate-nucleotide adenylyltransferase